MNTSKVQELKLLQIVMKQIHNIKEIKNKKKDREILENLEEQLSFKN